MKNPLGGVYFCVKLPHTIGFPFSTEVANWCSALACCKQSNPKFWERVCISCIITTFPSVSFQLSCACKIFQYYRGACTHLADVKERGLLLKIGPSIFIDICTHTERDAHPLLKLLTVHTLSLAKNVFWNFSRNQAASRTTLMGKIR